MERTGRLVEVVTQLVEPPLADMGYDLVRVRVGGGADMVIQVMAEPADQRAMTVDDCAAISRAVSALLDVEDPVAAAYTLEVSSPGLDRPLTRPRDFERFAGYEAKVELARPLDGRRRFRGRLLGLTAGAEGPAARLALPQGGEVELPLNRLAKAKLALTDEMLEAAAKGRPPRS